jgi:hypothetical protein
MNPGKLVESGRKSLEGITPWPWFRNGRVNTLVENSNRRCVVSTGAYSDNVSDGAYILENEANAKFIEDAPAHISLMADCIEELLSLLDESTQSQFSLAQELDLCQDEINLLESGLEEALGNIKDLEKDLKLSLIALRSVLKVDALNVRSTVHEMAQTYLENMEKKYEH